MRDTRPEDRPRERAARQGVHVLSDRELVAALLGSGTRGAGVLETSSRLLARGGVAWLARATIGELSRERGVGLAGAARLAAAFELGRRSQRDSRRPRVRDAAALARLTRPVLSAARQEVMLAVLLGARLDVVGVVEVARGGCSSASFGPGEALAPALREGAPRIAFVHNHPGGDPEPSADDERATSRLLAAARVVGIDLVDHLILGGRRWFSFAEAGGLSGFARRRRSE